MVFSIAFEREQIVTGCETRCMQGEAAILMFA